MPPTQRRGQSHRPQSPTTTQAGSGANRQLFPGRVEFWKVPRENIFSPTTNLHQTQQRRHRARIERDIENYLKGRQHLTKVIRFELSGEDPHLSLAYELDQAAFDTLAQSTFGRLVYSG